MSPELAFLLPNAAWVLLGISVIIVCGLVFYALYRKGDVSAEFSHGLTTFKLEAKDRARGRR